MERTEVSNQNFDGGLNTLICQEDLYDEEHPHSCSSNKYRQQVSMSSVASGRNGRQAVGILLLLAAVLLIVDIALGVHYNKLTDAHLTIDDTKHIENELKKLQDTYKTAIESMNSANKKVDSEKGQQTETNWEFEHQTRRKNNYEEQIAKITKDIASMKSHLPMIGDGCRHCPPGWVLINMVCYYFSLSDITGLKTWQKARDYCKLYGGDLLVIDSKDKENSTVTYLRNNNDPSKPLNGFWIGLRDLDDEGTWKWLDGTVLVEGYWNDDEPNDLNNEDCAAVYGTENLFKAWNDVRCSASLKWICEKSPTL